MSINYTATQIAQMTPAAFAALSNAVLALLPQSAYAGITAAQIAALPSAKLSYLRLEGLSPQAVAGLTTTQIAGAQINVSRLDLDWFNALTPTAVGALTLAQLSQISPKIFLYLNAAFVAALTSVQVSALSAAQVSNLSPANFAVLALNGLSPSAYAGILPNQVAALSSQKIGLLHEMQLLPLAVVAVLAPSQILGIVNFSALGPTWLMALRMDAVKALTPSQLKQISIATYHGLNATFLLRLSLAQIAALTSTQIAALTPATMSALNATWWNALQASAVAALRPDQLSQFPACQGLSLAFLACLQPHQVSIFTATQLAKFSDAQVQALNGTGWTGIQLRNANASGKVLWSLLTQKQITNLTAAQLASLAAQDIYLLSNSQVQALNVAKLTEIQLHDVNASGQTVLLLLTSKQIAGLTKAQLASVTASDINAWSNIQVQAVNAAGLSSAQLSYTSAAGNTVLSLLTPVQVGQLSQIPVFEPDSLMTFMDAGMFVWADGTFNQQGFEKTLTNTLGGSAAAGWNQQSKTTLNLGFAAIDANGKLVWGQPGTADQVAAFEKEANTFASYTQNKLAPLFGGIAVTFGGWSADDFGATATDIVMYAYQHIAPAQQLNWTLQQLQGVVANYGVNQISFDIENQLIDGLTTAAGTGYTLNQNSDAYKINQLRNQALAQFQNSSAGAGVGISLTLAVDPDGFTANVVEMLKEARAAGVKLASINLMCMDYTETKMAGLSMTTATLAAAKAVEAQLTTLGYGGTSLVLTLMAGVNDVQSQIMTVQDASAIAQYAAGDAQIIGVGLWSQNSDQNGYSLVDNGSAYHWTPGAFTQALARGESLSAAQLKGLTSAQVASLTATQLGLFDNEQVQALNGAGLSSTQLHYTNVAGNTVLSLLTSAQIGQLSQVPVSGADPLMTFVDAGMFVWADGTFSQQGFEKTLTNTLGGSGVTGWNNQSKSTLNLGFASINVNGKLVWGQPGTANQVTAFEKEAKAFASYAKDILVPRFAGIAVTFGGWSADDFGAAATDIVMYAYKHIAPAQQLNWTLQQLQGVVANYGVNQISFDIENQLIEGLTTDTGTGYTLNQNSDAYKMNQLRNQALAQFQKSSAGVGVGVSLTLAVDPDGFTANVVETLKEARSAGVKLASINLMCMDYTETKMAGLTMTTATLAAAKAVEAQLTTLGYGGTSLVLTLMAGVNDVQSEIMTVQDASAITQYAAGDAQIIGVGLWSQNSDQNGYSLVDNGNTYSWTPGAFTQALSGDHLSASQLGGLTQQQVSSLTTQQVGWLTDQDVQSLGMGVIGVGLGQLDYRDASNHTLLGTLTSAQLGQIATSGANQLVQAMASTMLEIERFASTAVTKTMTVAQANAFFTMHS